MRNVLINASSNRERELNGRALAEHAQELNLTTMHLDNLAADAETKSVRFSVTLCGEAPVKYTRDHLGRNTGARVRNLNVNHPYG